MFVKCSVPNVCNVYVKQSGAHLKCGVCWARRPVIILYQQHRWPVPPQAWWSSMRPVSCDTPIDQESLFYTHKYFWPDPSDPLWSSRETQLMVPCLKACIQAQPRIHAHNIGDLFHLARGMPREACDMPMHRTPYRSLGCPLSKDLEDQESWPRAIFHITLVNCWFAQSVFSCA